MYVTAAAAAATILDVVAAILHKPDFTGARGMAQGGAAGVTKRHGGILRPWPRPNLTAAQPPIIWLKKVHTSMPPYTQVARIISRLFNVI
jgi:hypothetical protein